MDARAVLLTQQFNVPFFFCHRAPHIIFLSLHLDLKFFVVHNTAYVGRHQQAQQADNSPIKT